MIDSAIPPRCGDHRLRQLDAVTSVR